LVSYYYYYYDLSKIYLRTYYMNAWHLWSVRIYPQIPLSRAQPESMQRAHARITTRLYSTRGRWRWRGRGRGRGRQAARQSVRGRDKRAGGFALMWTRMWLWGKGKGKGYASVDEDVAPGGVGVVVSCVLCATNWVRECGCLNWFRAFVWRVRRRVKPGVSLCKCPWVWVCACPRVCVSVQATGCSVGPPPPSTPPSPLPGCFCCCWQECLMAWRQPVVASNRNELGKKVGELLCKTNPKYST